MSDIPIRSSADVASDSWGFVGVVTVGDQEAYRTLEAFPTPLAATEAAQRLVAGLLGELLAGREWGAMRDQTGGVPTRRDFNLSALRRRRSDGGADETGRPPRPGRVDRADDEAS